MPSKARQLAKAMVENPIIEDMVTTPAAIPQTIVTETTTAATAIDANFNYATINALPGSANVGDQAFVQSTNRLYIWSGAGWYSIALINSTPTWDSGGQPLATYVLDADSPQDATIINLSASDPEGLPISYNYITSGSMDSMATISQDSSVFTITPKTAAQAPDGGTGTITFRASDGVNILPQVSSFTLNFISIIENSRYTTLLATATDTSDNNNITDSSTNNRTLTVNGDVYAGTFSPYRSGGYSTYFDGLSDNLSLTANSGFSLDSNFTIECWFNPSSITLDSQHPSILKIGTTQLYLNSSNNYVGFYHGTNDLVKSSNLSITENKWYHVSVTRSGSVLTLFLDGALVNTVNNITATFGASSGTVDIGTYSGTGGDFHGYISDLRIVKGTAITPPSGGPTERLQAVTNTSLLTCHLPYIADGSTNGHSITVNGNVSTKPFSPYDYEEYDAADNGGSVYHGGTAGYTDYIEGNYTAIGTNDFTFQFWVYPKTSSDIYAGYFSSKKSTSIPGSTVAKDTIDFGTNTSSGAAFGNPNIREEAWSHVAVVRSGDNSTAYVNGKSIGTISGTGSYNIASDRFWTMQRYGYNQAGGWPGKGYISDLKISQSVDYTADFTPPTSPLSSSGADIHIKSTDASIIDKSQDTNLKLFGNTTGSTTQVKFANTKSMYFDGTGDMTHSVLPFPLASKATIEFWMYSSATNKRYIFAIGLYTASSVLGIDTGSGTFSLRATSGGSGTTTQIIAGGAFSANTWYHVAIVKNNTSYELYVDGISKGVGAYGAANTYDSSYDVTIGSLSSNGTSASYPWSGYIQDFRITNGLRRYISNFTPPTASLEG